MKNMPQAHSVFRDTSEVVIKNLVSRAKVFS